MNSFVSGDKERIFINTVLGCNAQCKYCYLKSIGISGVVDRTTAEDIVAQLKEKSYFNWGKFGTVLTIGCYSECWDDGNKQEMKKLLKYLVEFGNYIQLATKQEITLDEIKEINSYCKYPHQIGIFISMPTISNALEIEPGTASITRRIKSIEHCLLVDNVYPVLYIKPVIKDITIKDLDLYKGLLDRLKIDCVVGSMLKYEEMGEYMVGNYSFSTVESKDEEYIRQYLKKKAPVFSYSTEVINKYRKMEKN